MTAPCGVPCFRSLTLPSGMHTGALSHRSIERRPHLQSVSRRSTPPKSSQSRVSKTLLLARSRTQSSRQPRWRATDRACCADRPGRDPYASAWTRGSRIGSRYRLTTIWAMRAPTVGMPHGLVRCSSFGLSTRAPATGSTCPRTADSTIDRGCFPTPGRTARSTAYQCPPRRDGPSPACRPPTRHAWPYHTVWSYPWRSAPRGLPPLILRPLIGVIDTALPLRYCSGYPKRACVFPIPAIRGSFLML